jgi:hypothetical protein
MDDVDAAINQPVRKPDMREQHFISPIRPPVDRGNRDIPALLDFSDALLDGCDGDIGKIE